MQSRPLVSTSSSSKWLMALASVVVTLGGASVVHARAQYPGQIPNTNQCSRCHINPNGGGARTLFGDQASDNKAGATTINWATLCLLDADGDSETNGAELGDPCCVWTQGMAPLSTTTSDPSTAGSVSGNTCPQPDAGTPIDAGAPPDGGINDAGLPPFDGGGVDAGPPPPPVDA